MLSAAAIADISHRLALQAADREVQPYNPASPEECIDWRTFPFPNIGDYRPSGWRLVDSAFVDKSGVGGEWGTLGTTGLKRWCAERVKADPTAGFAIVEEGEFQLYVGYFTQDDKVQKDEDAYLPGGESQEDLEADIAGHCSECGEFYEEEDEWCSECGARLTNRKIEIFDQVTVPDPNEEGDDLWEFEFVGTVINIRTDDNGEEIAVVEDQDGESFDVELSRLKLA